MARVGVGALCRGALALAEVTAPRPAGRAMRDWRWILAVLIIAGTTVLRLIIAGRLPLVPDEAYYWVWSRHLAAGYFDHPPMIALLIRLGTAVLGLTSVGVRLGPILAGTSAALATAAIARRLGGGDAAVGAAIVMSVLPLAAAGLVLATPDSPLLATFAVTLYFVIRAVEAPVHSRESLHWWIATGIGLGLAFCSKYTSIFLPVGVLLAIATHRELRSRFTELGPYLACVLATLIFVPVLIWNAKHGWVSFGFQLQHGLGDTESGGAAVLAAWHHEGDLFGGQLGLVSPILFILMAMAVVRALRPRVSDTRWVLAVVSVVSFVFFVYSALHKRVEANWPAPAYIGAIALVVSHPWGVRGHRWVTAGVAFAGVMSGLIYIHAFVPILPIPPAKDPVARAFGWESVASAALRASAEPGPSSGKRSWIAGDRYQEAAEISYSAGGIETFAVNLTSRPNQYDLWPGFPQRATLGDRLVLVVDETKDTHPAVAELAPYFDSILRGEQVQLRRGSAVVGERRIYSLDGWRGGWPRR
jgi:4-amino-4-deoxy-L-arabinose transferase-like glycosyltransferase